MTPFAELAVRIAIVSPYVPWKGTGHAGGQFLLHWARSLCERGVDVTLIAPNQQDLGLPPASDVCSEPFRVREFPLGGTPLTRRWGMRLTTTLLTPGWGVARALDQDQEAVRAISEADLVEIQWSQMLPLVKIASRQHQPVVGFVHDVMSESARRRVRMAQSSWERGLATARWPAYRLAEPRLLNKCAGVLTFSDRDRETLVNQGVHPPVRTIAPWIDQVSSPSGPSSAPVVLMVGDFGRPENSDGAMWFLRNCWPRVRAAVPMAELVFAGTQPPPGLQGPSVTATGWVDDLDEWYRRATVVIAPLLSGAGLKFKVAQAMTYGLPVVGTPVAADGYRERGGEDAFAGITSHPEAFADMVMACLRDPERAEAIGRRAVAWVGRTFDWNRSVDETLKWYQVLAEVTE